MSQGESSVARAAAPATVAGHHVKHPTWDPRLRELRWGNDQVKRFQKPAPAQECILAAFEEYGWPPRIDDPLPHRGEDNAKQHLRDTVKNLNRHQRGHRILFETDGTGRGVLWSLAPRSYPAATPEPPQENS
jgi:hypothetical protein